MKRFLIEFGHLAVFQDPVNWIGFGLFCFGLWINSSAFVGFPCKITLHRGLELVVLSMVLKTFSTSAMNICNFIDASREGITRAKEVKLY